MLKGGGGNMRKIVVAAGIVGILASSLSADALKNSLSKMIHEKETMPGMVDLSELDRPAATQMKKTRPSNAVKLKLFSSALHSLVTPLNEGLLNVVLIVDTILLL